jgi:hypothetical protein
MAVASVADDKLTWFEVEAAESLALVDPSGPNLQILRNPSARGVLALRLTA